jgi:RNA-splicing ligase RtcB
MDDIQKRADDKAWDGKQDRWISDANRRIEDGLSAEALAALHGLHVSPDDEPPYDVDEMSDVDDEETLRDKIIRRLIQIGDTFSGNRDLPDDVRQRWTATLQKC